MNTKKETKINNKKTGAAPINQHSPSTKNQNKTTLTHSNGQKDDDPIDKIDANASVDTNKTTPTKTSRNQVSANWNSVADTLKSQRNIPASKKIGKFHHTNIYSIHK